jgi:hypothetical protein
MPRSGCEVRCESKLIVAARGGLGVSSTARRPPHPAPEPPASVFPEKELEVFFQHSVLCQTDLPHPDPGEEVRLLLPACLRHFVRVLPLCLQLRA